MSEGIVVWWDGLAATDKAAWLSAIATAVATATALGSIVIATLVWKLTGDANRWQKFEKRAAIHRTTHEYLRRVLHERFKIQAPLTQNWWREIWVHRFLFKDNVCSFLAGIFESGAKLEVLSGGDEGEQDREERQKSRNFHSRRIAEAIDDLDRMFIDYLKFDGPR